MFRTTFIFSGIFFSCFFCVRHAHAQNEQTYDSLITQAFGLYEIKDYKASAEKYAEAFVAYGGKGNSTLFLVIQRADQKTQEQYLPMMREAVAK